VVAEIIHLRTTLVHLNGGRRKESESINERIKYLTMENCLRQDSRELRKWRNNLPTEFKYLSINSKCRSKKFRKLLFNSYYFKTIKFKSILEAIARYNQAEFYAGISRRDAEYYNSKLEPKNFNNFQLVKSNNTMAIKIKTENQKSIKKVEKELNKIINAGGDEEEKITKVASLIVESKNETQEMMRQGFVGLAIQNAELNKKLMKNNEFLEEQLNQLQKQFEIVINELQQRKQEERISAKKKEKRKNRKRLPKRDPITPEIYEKLIEESQKLSYSRSYRGIRLRLALALLTITGIRISELLPLTMGQVQNLFANHWISIDRLKRDPVNHKAYLNRQGEKLIKARLPDFEFMCYFKAEDSFIFTAEGVDKPLQREAFTNLINKFIKDSALKMDDQPKLTSHSFRIGFITQLWRDSSDIEFVRQSIGHSKIDTTSRYIESMSDNERKTRMQNISSPKDLIIDSNT
jgi:site-specific recombinase XerD